MKATVWWRRERLAMKSAQPYPAMIGFLFQHCFVFGLG